MWYWVKYCRNGIRIIDFNTSLQFKVFLKRKKNYVGGNAHCPWIRERQKAKVKSEKRWQIWNRVSSCVVFHKSKISKKFGPLSSILGLLWWSWAVAMVSWRTRVPSWGGGLLWRQLQWGIRNPLCPVLGTWSQTITAYLPFPGTDKLHKNQEDFEKPGSEMFWIDSTQIFKHPFPFDIEIKF